MAGVVKHQTQQLVKDKIIKEYKDEEDFKIGKILGSKEENSVG